jgi:hypothetical protein
VLSSELKNLIAEALPYCLFMGMVCNEFESSQVGTNSWLWRHDIDLQSAAEVEI